jgi:xylose isomerase
MRRQPSDQIVEISKACNDNGIVVPMVTVNLFYDPVFRDGAYGERR